MMSASFTSVFITLQVLHVTISKENQQKIPRLKKKEVNLFLFEDGMIIYIDNFNEFTQDLLELNKSQQDCRIYSIN